MVFVLVLLILLSSIWCGFLVKEVNRVVQNSIWLGVVTTVVLFLIICVLVTNNGWFSYDRFEKALSITSGYFSGVATLVAAYIASKLVANWKDQTKYNEQLSILVSIRNEATTLYLQLCEARHNESLAIYVTNLTQYLLSKELSDCSLNEHINELRKAYPPPCTRSIFESRKRFLDLLLNLKLYANNDSALFDVERAVLNIQNKIDVFTIQLKLAYNDNQIANKRNQQAFLNEWAARVFNLSYNASCLLKNKLIDVPFDFSDLNIMDNSMELDFTELDRLINKYRESLE